MFVYLTAFFLQNLTTIFVSIIHNFIISFYMEKNSRNDWLLWTCAGVSILFFWTSSHVYTLYSFNISSELPLYIQNAYIYLFRCDFVCLIFLFLLIFRYYYCSFIFFCSQIVGWIHTVKKFKAAMQVSRCQQRCFVRYCRY